MFDNDLELTRRRWLKETANKATIMVVAGIGATLPVSQRAAAAQLTSQAAAGYVDQPAADGDHCAACQFFIAGAGGSSGPGTCQAVAGSINPQGHCSFFSPK
jgi:hypothetical protein